MNTVKILELLVWIGFTTLAVVVVWRHRRAVTRERRVSMEDSERRFPPAAAALALAGLAGLAWWASGGGMC